MASFSKSVVLEVYSDFINNFSEVAAPLASLSSSRAFDASASYISAEHCLRRDFAPNQVRDAAEKKRDFLGIFPKGGGGGLLKSQNFCKFTKCFFVCQNHS